MSKNNSGYLSFAIYNKNLKKTKSYFQHRFVYEVLLMEKFLLILRLITSMELKQITKK